MLIVFGENVQYFNKFLLTSAFGDPKKFYFFLLYLTKRLTTIVPGYYLKKRNDQKGKARIKLHPQLNIWWSIFMLWRLKKQ